ncbi:MAG: PD-(D/E)XK nuclease family protein [Opitutaceae bacterium]|nr:PD-(D/E)XK nuclease family protein [Opitutaceae bacterium]
MPSSANVRRHFLPWDRPLLPQAVAWLAGDWAGGVPLDLSSLLVLVPTKQSGRRLREALAAYAAEKRQAVFPPKVLPLAALIGAEDAAVQVASRLESLLAWTEVLQAAEPEEFRAVLPIDPPARNFTWAAGLAREFVRLQDTLAEVGLQLGDVPQKVEPTFPERERWQQIAILEARQAEKLAALGLRDGQAAKIRQARAAVLPAGITRVVMIATPDPRPIALTVLAQHAAKLPVDVLIFAPEGEAAAFDDWGRPQPEGWARRALELADFERNVRLCADPAAQAERVVAVAQSYRGTDGMLGVGIVDPEILPLAESGLRQAGLASFNPEGRRRHGDGLYQLLAALAGLVRDETFATVEKLARCPDFLRYLETRLGGAFSVARFLTKLDGLRADHLPPDLLEARRHEPEMAELAAVAELRAALVTGTFPANAADVLAEIFRARQLDPAVAAEGALAASAEAWTDVMHEAAEAAGHFQQLTMVDWWELALRLYGETVRFEEKPAGAVELQGWLELIWEDAPHLIAAGLNDGQVPEAIVGDPYLPELLRVRLGLKTNAMRFACDAYALQALAAARTPGGRLEVFLGKTSAAGDPLRPSRLLLRCADEELPRRIAFLFNPVDTDGVNLPWERAWQLRPPQVAAPERVAVTALRAWLHCPFRFYLSRVLTLQAVDPAKAELGAMDFGTLCHVALEAMGNDPVMRDCVDAKVLRGFLLEALEAAATQRFGSELTLPLIVQLEAARQRLAQAAAVQAQTRAEGWVIERVEWKFKLAVAGLIVSGKIDRIDRHEPSGVIRVLDYKTSDTPVPPAQAHLRGRRKNEDVPACAVLNRGAGEEVWADLQLPLYERALAAEFPAGQIRCGYFNLPKAVTETEIALWEDYSPELAAAAWSCAEGVARAIRAGEFWPPRELKGYEAEQDDFAALFHHGAAASVVFGGREGGA